MPVISGPWAYDLGMGDSTVMTRKPIGFVSALALGALAVFGSGSPSHAQTQSGVTTATQMTVSYRIELDIGPAAVMLTPDQVASATSGEAMVDMSQMSMAMSAGTMSASMATPMSGGNLSMPGGSMGGVPQTNMMAMATTDDGQPVNHHLEAHIYNRASGAVVTDMVPTITITNESTGETRSLDDVMAMYDIQVGMNDLHFGNNVYLPDGMYTIQAMVGQEMIQFAHLAVSGGMGLPADGMGPMVPSQPMQTMP